MKPNNNKNNNENKTNHESASWLVPPGTAATARVITSGPPPLPPPHNSSSNNDKSNTAFTSVSSLTLSQLQLQSSSTIYHRRGSSLVVAAPSHPASNSNSTANPATGSGLVSWSSSHHSSSKATVSTQAFSHSSSSALLLDSSSSSFFGEPLILQEVAVTPTTETAVLTKEQNPHDGWLQEEEDSEPEKEESEETTDQNPPRETNQTRRIRPFPTTMTNASTTTTGASQPLLTFYELIDLLQSTHCADRPPPLNAMDHDSNRYQPASATPLPTTTTATNTTTTVLHQLIALLHSVNHSDDNKDHNRSSNMEMKPQPTHTTDGSRLATRTQRSNSRERGTMRLQPNKGKEQHDENKEEENETTRQKNLLSHPETQQEELPPQTTNPVPIRPADRTPSCVRHNQPQEAATANEDDDEAPLDAASQDATSAFYTGGADSSLVHTDHSCHQKPLAPSGHDDDEPDEASSMDSTHQHAATDPMASSVWLWSLHPPRPVPPAVALVGSSHDNDNEEEDRAVTSPRHQHEYQQLGGGRRRRTIRLEYHDDDDDTTDSTQDEQDIVDSAVPTDEDLVIRLYDAHQEIQDGGDKDHDNEAQDEEEEAEVSLDPMDLWSVTRRGNNNNDNEEEVSLDPLDLWHDAIPKRSNHKPRHQLAQPPNYPFWRRLAPPQPLSAAPITRVEQPQDPNSTFEETSVRSSHTRPCAVQIQWPRQYPQHDDDDDQDGERNKRNVKDCEEVSLNVEDLWVGETNITTQSQGDDAKRIQPSQTKKTRPETVPNDDNNDHHHRHDFSPEDQEEHMTNEDDYDDDSSFTLQYETDSVASSVTWYDDDHDEEEEEENSSDRVMMPSKRMARKSRPRLLTQERNSYARQRHRADEPPALATEPNHADLSPSHQPMALPIGVQIQMQEESEKNAMLTSPPRTSRETKTTPSLTTNLMSLTGSPFVSRPMNQHRRRRRRRERAHLRPHPPQGFWSGDNSGPISPTRSLPTPSPPHDTMKRVPHVFVNHPTGASSTSDPRGSSIQNMTHETGEGGVAGVSAAAEYVASLRRSRAHRLQQQQQSSSSHDQLLVVDDDDDDEVDPDLMRALMEQQDPDDSDNSLHDTTKDDSVEAKHGPQAQEDEEPLPSAAAPDSPSAMATTTGDSIWMSVGGGGASPYGEMDSLEYYRTRNNNNNTQETRSTSAASPPRRQRRRRQASRQQHSLPDRPKESRRAAAR